jgi:anti-sigma regulatory factor (Ser/Thr protein kinase)
MEHAGFQHEALLYEGPDEYLAGTVPYLRTALESGEPAMAAVRRPQAELLKRELGEDGEGVLFVEIEEVGRNPASVIPLWREFVDEACGRPVRGIGETVWADRSPAAIDECQRHEALLNLAFGPRPSWSLLCPYDAASLGDEVLEQVGHSHTCLHRHGQEEDSSSFEPHPDCLAGELPPPKAIPEEIEFGLAQLKEVRDRVTAAAERAEMDQLGIADLVTATSELAANSVMHGGGNGTLRLWREGDTLLAEVEDRGRIEEPLVGRLRPEIKQEGGRGLWLANRLCDLVQIRSDAGGTTVRLHVLARKSAPAPLPFDVGALGGHAG